MGPGFIDLVIFFTTNFCTNNFVGSKKFICASLHNICVHSPTSGLIWTAIISKLTIMPLCLVNIKSMCKFYITIQSSMVCLLAIMPLCIVNIKFTHRFYITIQSSSSFGMACLNGNCGNVTRVVCKVDV